MDKTWTKMLQGPRVVNYYVLLQWSMSTNSWPDSNLKQIWAFKACLPYVLYLRLVFMKWAGSFEGQFCGHVWPWFQWNHLMNIHSHQTFMNVIMWLCEYVWCLVTTKRDTTIQRMTIRRMLIERHFWLHCWLSDFIK